jgi:trehalose synthase
VIPGTTEFFEVTKGFHNALQGAELDLTEEVKSTYLRQNRLIAEQFDGQYDFVCVHDPQPVPLRTLAGPKNARWVWRCHIDTSQPNAQVLAFLDPFVSEYDALVFTL